MILVKANWPDDLVDRLRNETGEEVIRTENPDDALLARTDILMAYHVDESLFDRCKSLKFLFSLSAGVEGLPFDTLRAKQIALANTSGIHGRQMSEQMLGVMLGFSRSLFLHRDDQNRKVWNFDLPGGELGGQTLLVVGAGRIGQVLAARAKAFDMRVLGLKKHAAPLSGFDDVQSIDRLHDLLPLADYVVLLTPLLPETEKLMDAAAFARMKKTAVFLNYSRGGTVDEDALVASLQNGTIAGAGLDVFREEPLPPESPLWSMPNVFITPHTAGKSDYYAIRSLEVFLEDYAAWKAGKPMPTQVDLLRKY